MVQEDIHNLKIILEDKDNSKSLKIQIFIIDSRLLNSSNGIQKTVEECI